MDAREVLLGNVALTWALVGLIWTVQVVQYPGFAHVGRGEFGRFHEHHCARISLVVAPLMCGELLTSALLLFDRPAGLSHAEAVVGFGLVVAIWLTTALVSVPQHGGLTRPTGVAIRRLVRANWIRTAAWTARGVWAWQALVRIAA